MAKIIKHSVTPKTLKKEFDRIVDEVYSHPVRGFSIEVSADRTTLPTMSVAFEYIVLEEELE